MVDKAKMPSDWDLKGRDGYDPDLVLEDELNLLKEESKLSDEELLDFAKGWKFAEATVFIP